MADNSSALAQGTKVMKNIITADIMNRIGSFMLENTRQLQTTMKKELPGMTGNAVTSAAGATYNKGSIQAVVNTGMLDSTSPPLQPKLKKGQKFKAGRTRYDGSQQASTFTATEQTTGQTSQADNFDLIKSLASGNDFKAVIIGGTEYLGATQVSDNFSFAENNIDKYFQRKDV